MAFARRKPVLVNVPIKNDVSYSLFAQGILMDVPTENVLKSRYEFRFLGNSAFCLFYTFANFRRAYIAASWLNKDDGEKVFLPGIDDPLYVIFKAKGRKIDELKRILFILTKEDRYAPFRLKLDFWKELAFKIEYEDCPRERIIFLYNKYSAKNRRIKL